MKIVVNNLPVDITEDRLKNFFDQIGAVESVRIKTSPFTGRPSGSGTVEMALDVDAFRAVNCFNGATFKDRKIYLVEAQPLLAQARHFLKDTVTVHTKNFQFPVILRKKHDH
jgi:RNA recognition motif-containing protein